MTGIYHVYTMYIPYIDQTVCDITVIYQEYTWYIPNCIYHVYHIYCNDIQHMYRVYTEYILSIYIVYTEHIHTVYTEYILVFTRFVPSIY